MDEKDPALLVRFTSEPELYEWLRLKSFNERRPMAEIVRDLLKLEKEKSSN